ncbi:MAG: MBL fold metallo-hydrolase [Erysipelotrichales bacterium]
MNDYIKHIRGNTYYIPSRTNVGVIKKDDSVILIDSGNDKDAGRKIRMNLDKLDLKVEYILSTHSNADHVGANAYLINQYKIKAYSYKREVPITKYPDLESTILYGGKPTKAMQNKFLMAKPSAMEDIELLEDKTLSYFELEGHFLDMIGFKSEDDVYFIADSLFSEEVVNKYHLFYIFNVGGYLKTLDYLETLNDGHNIFVASHLEISNDISNTIKVNRNKILEVLDFLRDLLQTTNSFEAILKEVFIHYDLVMDINQYLLIGSTIKNYLTYLNDLGEVDLVIEDNELLYKLKGAVTHKKL